MITTYYYTLNNNIKVKKMLTNQTARVNFASVKHTPEYPDFLDIQIKSFQEFFQMETKSEDRVHEGLYQTLKKTFL